jgi:hypothetical protein
MPGGGDDNVNFGDGQDHLQSAGNTSLVARIQNVAIRGNVYGSLTAGDHFGFIAQQFGQLKIAGKAIALNAGPGNDDFAIPIVGDVNVKEVS